MEGSTGWNRRQPGSEDDLVERELLARRPGGNHRHSRPDLSGSAPTVEVGGPGGGGFTPFLRNFILVGVELPEPGCWEVTASYQGAELTYVVQVEK